MSKNEARLGRVNEELMRSQVAKIVKLRVTPELVFEYDD